MTKENIFAKAGKTAPKKKASKKSDKREVKLSNLETLSALKSVMKAMEGLMATTEASVKDQMAAEFLTAGLAVKKRPDNFRGIEGGASASCELRKRSTRSTLSDEDAAILDKFGIEIKTEVDVTETYVINPAYKDDSDLLAKVSEAISEIDGMPEDFIQLQAGVERKVVGDSALDQIFQKGNNIDVASLLQIVGTLAIKPKLESGDIAEALKIITDVITDDDE